MKSDARRSLTDLRASLFDIIIFRRKELTTEPRGRAFRRQFLPLSRKRLGLEAAQRIFLVQGPRNQWLCEFACTKAAADFERRRLRPVGYRLRRRTAGLRATSSVVFPSLWCASGIPAFAFRPLPCASVLRFSASSPRSRRSPGVLS